jgi:Flp pilus assembly protein TadD
MVFWREHSGLASPLPLLGATPLFALGISSLLVLRGRREGMILAALLLVSLLVWRFTAAGASLLLFALSLLAVLSGAWVDALWGSVRLSRWRALAVLLVPALLLMALGARLSTVDETQMAEVELELRLERVKLLCANYRDGEVRDDMQWMREKFPTDRRVRLADAELMLERGEYREVVRVFKQLRREYPEWSATLMGAGWANFYNETYPTAERYFREILEGDPANPRALVGLGACAIYNSKDYVEAERLIMEGLALDEEIAEGHHNMALLLIKSRTLYDSEEKMTQLRHHARRAMELDPTNDDMRRFVRRSGWYDLLPEDERPNQVPGREEARP